LCTGHTGNQGGYSSGQGTTGAGHGVSGGSLNTPTTGQQTTGHSGHGQGSDYREAPITGHAGQGMGHTGGHHTTGQGSGYSGGNPTTGQGSGYAGNPTSTTTTTTTQGHSPPPQLFPLLCCVVCWWVGYFAVATGVHVFFGVAEAKNPGTAHMTGGEKLKAAIPGTAVRPRLFPLCAPCSRTTSMLFTVPVCVWGEGGGGGGVVFCGSGRSSLMVVPFFRVHVFAQGLFCVI
jgi:hypothetical protein